MYCVVTVLPHESLTLSVLQYDCQFSAASQLPTDLSPTDLYLPDLYLIGKK